MSQLHNTIHIETDHYLLTSCAGKQAIFLFSPSVCLCVCLCLHKK